jgi:competence protein ComGC
MNTTLVESDFSILKWEKNSNQKSLTNLAFEGIFASKQHNRLTKI